MSKSPVFINDEPLELNCLIEGESVVFTVAAVHQVGGLKEVIQRKRASDTLKDVGPDMLELWKVDIDLDTHTDSLSNLKPENVKLQPWKPILEYWSGQPPNSHLHIIVRVPAIDVEADDLSVWQERQKMRYSTCLTPSSVCKEAKLMKSQQDFAEILNGRPWTSLGPPLGIYHPVFDSFSAHFKSESEYRTAAIPSFADAFSFMRASSQFYEVEQSGREEGVMEFFSSLLGIDLLRIKNSDRAEFNTMALAPIFNGRSGLLAIVELKLEEGIGGDAKTQVQQSYARVCSSPQYDDLRLSCCCPSFLVAISGPYITVFGAVFVQKVIIKHLAGPIYLPPDALERTTDIPLRLFYALRRAILDLHQYYEALPRQKTESRFYPFVRSYELPSGDTMDFNYLKSLSPDDESKAVYLAKQADGKDIVVKFALTYNTRAHHLLADHGLAPQLIYDGTRGPRYGGLVMIVMDYVKGVTLYDYLRSSLHLDRLKAAILLVEKAVSLLHGENLVFGDLRSPNIIVDDGVKIIDYDWCGVHQKDRYPLVISDGINWAKGVGSMALMDKGHDLFMLERLEANIRGRFPPGVW